MRFQAKLMPLTPQPEWFDRLFSPPPSPPTPAPCSFRSCFHRMLKHHPSKTKNAPQINPTPQAQKKGTASNNKPNLPHSHNPLLGLHYGSRGAAVRRLQTILRKWNRHLGITLNGVYDEATRRAVALYQAIYSHPSTGERLDPLSARYLLKMEDGTFWLNPPPKTAAQKLLYHASRKLGTPYRLGGDGARSIDCGLLTKHALLGSGVVGSASRLADEQYKAALRKKEGLRLVKRHAQAGDLIFFRLPTRQSSIAYQGITHVGIYVAPGLMLAASQKAGRVILQRLHPLRPYIAGYGRLQDNRLTRQVVPPLTTKT